MRISLKQSLGILTIITILVLIFLYGYRQSIAVLEGPAIEIREPLNGQSATTSLLRVLGTTKHVKELTLQGRTIYIDLEGRVDERLLLTPGYTIIELRAKDAQGREIRVVREVTYAPTVVDVVTFNPIDHGTEKSKEDNE